MSNPWLSPDVARQQRALADQQLQNWQQLPHFQALVAAVKATQCPGELLVTGCGVGQERELLDRAGVEYRSFAGIDISPDAIRLAKERYPESSWLNTDLAHLGPAKADVVVDSACLMHVDDWRAHLAALCKASRRWLVLHRVPYAAGMPLGTGAWQKPTNGYGHEFPAWEFGANDLYAEMESHGFELQGPHTAYGGQATLVFAKARHYASYCDAAYLPRLKALHASMVRHCGPFYLDVLSYDQAVTDWCDKTAGVVAWEVEDFTAERPHLCQDKLPGPARTKAEYMFTLGPWFLAATMEKYGEPVTYCDADLLFHSSPEPVFAEIGGAHAAVVPHGFADVSQGLPGPTRQTHEVFGKFNVGIVYAADRAFVERWAEQCRRWCYDRLERTMLVSEDDRWTPADIKYGDQKWLEHWESDGAHVVQHPGACLGPWAAHTRSLDVRDGVIHFGNRPLVSYHYSSYREGPHGQEQLTRPEYALAERQAEILYTPYIRALKEAK